VIKVGWVKGSQTKCVNLKACGYLMTNKSHFYPTRIPLSPVGQASRLFYFFM